MKRLLALIFTVLLLLTGCTNIDSPETETETMETTEAADPGLYVPGSKTEKETEGAVREYALPEGAFSRMEMVGDRLLLAEEGDNPALLLLEGIDASNGGEGQLPTDKYTVTQSGIAYMDEITREAVYLDSRLQEINRIALPEDMSGAPLFSADCAQIFYCTGNEIRSLDLEQEISRLVKTHTYKQQDLAESYFGGKYVFCEAQGEDGTAYSLYVSTQDGTTVSKDPGICQLHTWQDQYMAVREDGSVRQIIFGALDQTPQQLNIPQTHVRPALAVGGIIGVGTDAEETLTLSFYQLKSGEKTAQLSLENMTKLNAICADASKKGVWLLGENEAEKMLLFWSTASGKATDETVYTGPVISEASPDEEGLQLLNERVSQINDNHGTSVRIWQDAVKITGEHNLKPEYQTQAISDTLDALEQVFAQFPESFLLKSVNSKIRICVVRSVDGNTDPVWFWNDADAYILIPTGSDVSAGFLWAMSYIVDVHILGNSPMLDYWEENNPEGFQYGNEAEEELLTSENRCFVDEKAMTSVTEDRAAIFRQAIQPDNADVFKAEAMQKKLLLLCRAIRDAWGLERKTDTYVWEQYLNESIAYQK